MKQVKKRIVQRFSKGHFKQIEDIIAVEYPITIKINGKEFITIVCTPEYIEDMVIGFLASERVIGKYEDIQKIWVQKELGFVHIETSKVFPFYEQMHSKRYITSCCGMSRQGFVFANDALTAKQITETNVTLTPEECFYLMQEMEKTAAVFHHTGGVHNAALCTQKGVVLARMDIGRHNALDKIYGHCLRNTISVHDKIIVFSGRISSEILLKVAKIGCEIVLSKSAPTELALELAEELGITTVGFIRNESFNVYTHPERIVINKSTRF
ncbi:formate dehydrogenase accessory sulfurtransferase FdhD [Sporosarcina ureilytica]|uniref:Sulfur carrier protein FdhD n=1 Tax=Sporosarcina ureilytica TaxID=298596 RepID=A0A1D8JFN1_9BACL|nr:formate dehydrogenase accessory sulfurtransferase FdhD [Sporosarcina ureilytica]AOV07509.1 sufurtransferase FdhD [Sporosarcina ureilytica]